jgi:uncharacterized membrane protein YjfL (UPF0719 family)
LTEPPLAAHTEARQGLAAESPVIWGGPMHWIDVATGITAFAVALLASVLLVFGLYRLNTVITSRIDEERFLLQGNRSVAIALGAVVLSQALLLRHAVFPTMAVLRNALVGPITLGAVGRALLQATLFFAIVGGLSFISVVVAAWLFSRMTRSLAEREQILKDNVAVAILFAFIVIAVALVVNEGLVDLSRSIIPYPESGIIQIP